METVDETPSVDIPYESPVPSDQSKVYFAEHFDDPTQFEKKWVKSKTKKEGISEDIAKYDGEWAIEPPQRDGLAGKKLIKKPRRTCKFSLPSQIQFGFHDTNDLDKSVLPWKLL